MVHSGGMAPFMIWILAVVLSSVKSTLCHPIVNGSPPRDPHQFNFAVSLQRRLTNGTLIHFCGGIYLGAGWILTANHCIVGSTRHSEIYAHLGGLPQGTGNGTNLYWVRKKLSHPDYNPVTLAGDIALLQLSSSASDQQDSSNALQLLDKMVSSTLLLPINPGNSFNSFEVVGQATIGEECHIFGYGSASFYGPGSDRLQYGPVQPLSFDRCVQMLGPVVAPVAPNSGMFCAIGTTDACRGDSGSGLVCRRRIWRPLRGDNGEVGPYTLRGIISYGAGCGAPASPGVYTDVGFYRRWIDEMPNSV